MDLAGGLAGVFPPRGEGLALIPAEEGADPTQALGGPVGVATDREVRKKELGRKVRMASANWWR
jgi:hypothetical protein